MINPLAAIPVAESGLSIRTKNALHNSFPDCRTLADLETIDEVSFLRTPNVSRGALQDMKNYIADIKRVCSVRDVDGYVEELCKLYKKRSDAYRNQNELLWDVLFEVMAQVKRATPENLALVKDNVAREGVKLAAWEADKQWV